MDFCTLCILLCVHYETSNSRKNLTVQQWQSFKQKRFQILFFLKESFFSSRHWAKANPKICKFLLQSQYLSKEREREKEKERAREESPRSTIIKIYWPDNKHARNLNFLVDSVFAQLSRPNNICSRHSWNVN